MNRRKHICTPYKMNPQNSLGYSRNSFLPCMYPARIIKRKFQVKKSLSQRPAETKKKLSIFAPFWCSFSKPLLMVARNRTWAETDFCSDTSEAAFIFLFHTGDQGSVYTVKSKFTFWISQRGGICEGDWEQREKAKQPGSDVGDRLKSSSDQQDKPHENGLVPRGVRDSGRGIKYVRRKPQKSLEK